MARKATERRSWIEDLVGGLVFWATAGVIGVPLLGAAVIVLVILLAVKW